MANEFKVTKFNEEGHAKVKYFAGEFETFLAKIEAVLPAGRKRSIIATKLEEMYGFLKSGLADQKAYTEEE